MRISNNGPAYRNTFAMAKSIVKRLEKLEQAFLCTAVFLIVLRQMMAIMNLFNDASTLNRASFSSYNSYIFCVGLSLIKRFVSRQIIAQACKMFKLRRLIKLKSAIHDSASKRRSINLLSLSFVSKLFSKKFLIKCLT